MAKKNETMPRPVNEILLSEGSYQRTVQQFQPYVPAGRQSVPSSIREALEATRAVLVAEAEDVDATNDRLATEAAAIADGTADDATVDRWLKAGWFQNDHPELDPEDAYCNDWSACLQGIIGIVTFGASRRVDIYEEAEEQPYKTRWEFLSDPTEHMWDALKKVPGAALYKATVAYLTPLLPKRQMEQYNDETDSYDLVDLERRWASIPEFNDAGPTTRTDVLAFVESVIEDAPTETIPAVLSDDE